MRVHIESASSTETIYYLNRKHSLKFRVHGQGSETLDYTSLDRKDFKLDQAIHVVREVYAFLKMPYIKKSVSDLQDEHSTCSQFLKMINAALELMMLRKRDLLMRDSSVDDRVFHRQKYPQSRINRIKSDELRSNRSLIENLSSDLSRLTSMAATVGNAA